MKIIKRAGAALTLLLFTGPAFAVICESASDGRYMDFVPDSGTATCFLSGSTPPPEGQVHEDLGFTLIEKLEDDDGSGGIGTWFDVSGLGGTSGDFTITSADFYDLFGNVHVVFKFGNGQLEPDWFDYAIEDVFSADWQLYQSQLPLQALSHVTLYGERISVPAPGVAALLGIGLLALLAAFRRR